MALQDQTGSEKSNKEKEVPYRNGIPDAEVYKYTPTAFLVSCLTAANSRCREVSQRQQTVMLLIQNPSLKQSDT